MHIKKLEITGFKSFVDRTVVHFDHDVIGVVGPNGCGKSNIVDAIRWCMGEQSAKHLRGRSMEDVIFNGSESRPPAGLSEVTLTFENNDPDYASSLPQAYQGYPEIAVTRRLFRDGTSEYLINKTPVRLRDITELFLGTGVGTKAYSIVEQGRIGQIVSSRPQDRRTYIEEAAGITKYKQRRRQAERKMDLTRQNLLRVTDIVAEIDRSRASLKRQAAKAERFLKYRTELEDLFLHDASHRLLEMIVTHRVAEEGRGAAEKATTEARVTVNQEDTALDAARTEAHEIEARADAAAKKAHEADHKVTSIKAEYERGQDRLVHLDERLASGERERTDIATRLQSLGEEQRSLDEVIADHCKTEASFTEDASKEERALSEIQQAEMAAVGKVQGARTALAETSSELAATRVRLDALQHRIDDAALRREKLAEEQSNLGSEGSAHENALADLQSQVDRMLQEKRDAHDVVTDLEVRLAELKPEADSSKRAATKASEELGQHSSRLAALEELHERLEGVGAGARSLLASGDPAVRGIVADHVEVSEEFTDAVAGLLGDRLQAVIVKDPAEALRLLDGLRETASGRATLAPQTPIVPSTQAAEEAAQDSRVLGRLLDKLRFNEENASLMRSLVGDALLVQSPTDALGVVSNHPRVTAVALDGTVVGPDGVVSGGAGDGVASAMVEQKREIARLTGSVEALRQSSVQLAARSDELAKQVATLETELLEARRNAHKADLGFLTAEKDLARVKSDLERAEFRTKALQDDIQELEERTAQWRQEMEQSRSGIAELEKKLEAHSGELAEAEAEAQGWKEKANSQAALVTDRLVHLAQVREQLGSARAATKRVQDSISDLRERSAHLENDLSEAAKASGETSAQLMLYKELEADAKTASATAHKELSEVRQLLEQIRTALVARETALKQLRDDLSGSEDDLRKFEMDVQKIEIQRTHLLQSVRERFRGLDLARVVGDYHSRPAPDTEHRRRIDELTKLIDRMGPVNLDARAEYEESEKRFVELSVQKDDIEQALEKLTQAIRHMDRESKRLFRETYNTVNELFKQTFRRMFKGGRAELRLTDPDNLLETGVDIIAQPPGKKLGNIELMSGGEKALTATSLIFSIFQHRPSPFCVLDEVDAPLDEANVTRYCEAIRSMTAKSQFILITHIKKTMSEVDVLYGVTMGEPGVSRLVSVKVNEEAKARSERAAGALDSSQAPAEEPATSQVA